MTAPREAPTLEDLIWVMNNMHESVLPGDSRNTIIASLERLRAIENAKGVPERQLAEAIADVEKLREEKRNMWERGIILENQLAELQRKHDGLVARLREPSVEMIEAGKKVFIDFPANGHLYQEIRLIHKAMSAVALKGGE